MQYGQQQKGPMNNDMAIKILWGGIISYVLGFILPQITVPLINESLATWDLLTNLGMMMIIASIGLTYNAITKAKLFLGVKKFGVTSSIIMLIPMAAIYFQFNDLNILSVEALGFEIYELGIGYYLLWIGAILSTVGSFKAQFTSQYRVYPAYQPQQYQQQQYQKQQYQPQQPPSYLDPQEDSIHSQSDIKSNQEVIKKQPTNQGLICRNCGSQYDINGNFCEKCGQQLN